MNCSVPIAHYIIQSCTVLHNFSMAEESKYCPPNFIDHEDQYGNIVLGEWRRATPPNGTYRSAQRGKGRKMQNAVNQMRDNLARWCTVEGAVDWQDQMIA